MADKSQNGPGEADDPGVLASLPSTRPNRLSRRGRDAAAPAAKPAAKPKKPAAKRKPKAKAKAKPAPAPTPISAATEKQQRPTAVRAAHPTLGKPSAPPPAKREQGGVDLVKTVVQAAGEVAQLGATVGGQILKRAVDKLPKRP